MVDDDAVKRVADSVGSADVGSHVLVAVLGACERAVERVDADGDRDVLADLPPDVVDQGLGVGGERERVGDEEERRAWRIVRARELGAPEGLLALAEALRSFEADVDDGALLDAQASIAPAECDVHEQVGGPEALAALRRTPDDDEAAPPQEAFDAIVLSAEQLNVGEAAEDEARRRLLQSRILADGRRAAPPTAPTACLWRPGRRS